MDVSLLIPHLPLFFLFLFLCLWLLLLLLFLLLSSLKIKKLNSYYMCCTEKCNSIKVQVKSSST